MSEKSAATKPVHEVVDPPQTPDFRKEVVRLEGLGRDGVETPRGMEHLEFRVGVETEFSLHNPKEYLKELHGENVSKTTYDYNLGLAANPETMYQDPVDNAEAVIHFQSYVTDWLNDLPAATPAEEARRQKWLDQISDFGVPEIINFALYEEFSKPTLSDVKLSADSTVEELDAFSEQQGWLEFRFGMDGLQAGYYDNPNVSEIRMTPCEPSEAIRRKQIIDARLAELGTEFGALVRTGSFYEHINLSVHRQREDGTYEPMVGQSADRQEYTQGLAAGMAAAWQDGVWLNEKDMKWDYKFDAKYGGKKIGIGPTRRSMRIIDGRIELRSNFEAADQAINWLVAGSLYGAEQGVEALIAAGYHVPAIKDDLRVHREAGFNKHADLQIQRAIENSEFVDGHFELNTGWNWVAGDKLTALLVGGNHEIKRGDSLNEFVIGSVALDDQGRLSVSAEHMLEKYRALDDNGGWQNPKAALTELNFPAEVIKIAKNTNAALAKIWIEKVKTIKDDIEYKVDGRDLALARLASRKTGQLAYGRQLDQYIAWLGATPYYAEEDKQFGVKTPDVPAASTTS